MNDYDVIVIGAGNGGLVAALTAINESYKVLLLEAQNEPGAFASSFVKGRFEFENSLFQLASYGTPDKVGKLKKVFDNLGIGSKLNFVSIPEAFRVITTENIENDKKDYIMPFGIKKFIAKMEEYVPESSESMKSLFDLALECRNALAYIEECYGEIDEDEMKSKYENFMRVSTYSVSKVLDTLGIPLKAQEILNTFWLYFGYPETELSFVQYASLLYDIIDLKIQIPLNKSYDISLTLAEEFINRGGELKYGSVVSKILVNDGEINGVKLNDGSIFFAKHVISNVSPHMVYGKLIDPTDVPRRALKNCNQRELGCTGFTVYLGLNRSPQQLGIDNYSYFLYNTLDSDLEYQRMQKITHTNQMAICLNNAIPECSAEGTTLLTLTTYYFDECFEKHLNPNEYLDLKEEIAINLINTFEEATGIVIKDYIEEIEISTPLTFARHSNYILTFAYGYKFTTDDSYLSRILNEENENYIKGLRFCGGFAAGGFGFSETYLSGYRAMKLTQKDMVGE